MACTVVFEYLESGLELELELRDDAGAVVNGEPDAFVEPTDPAIPGRYEATVEEELTGWYTARVIDSEGVLHINRVKLTPDAVCIIGDPAAAEHVPPTVGEIRTEMESDGSILEGLHNFNPATDTVKLATDQAVNVTKVAGASVSGVNDFKADISSLATSSQVSGLSIPTVSQIRTELDTNSTKLANLDTTVSSRSTLTAAQVWAHATATALISAISTIATQVATIFGKLPTASRLAGSPNEDGSIDVDVGDVTVTGEVIVKGFTAAAKQQLDGTTVRHTTPVFTIDGFDRPIISGDAYIDGRELVLTVEDYVGPALETADSIVMFGTHGAAEFEWTFEPEKIGEGIYSLTASLTSEDTDIPKGKWLVHLFATFGSDSVTLIGPRATLQVIGR